MPTDSLSVLCCVVLIECLVPRYTNFIAVVDELLKGEAVGPSNRGNVIGMELLWTAEPQRWAIRTCS